MRRGTLAIIDMQQVFGASDSPWASPRFDEIVPAIKRLIAAFGDNVVFTQWISPARPEGAWVGYFKDWPFALQPPDAPLWKITPALADAADAAAESGHGPIVASTFSKWGPQMAGIATDRLVLTGVSTECCIVATALAAADAGVEVVVVSDATSGPDDATQRSTLDLMATWSPLIRIATTDEVLGVAQG